MPASSRHAWFRGVGGATTRVADTFLLFLASDGEFEGWLRIADDRIVDRGSGTDRLAVPVDPVDGTPGLQVLIVPGDAVALHWLEVPGGLAPAQAAAAGRIAAAEVSTQPLTDMHVAIGAEQEGRAERVVAIVPALAMMNWLSRSEAAGVDPDLILPEPLLLPVPDEGFVRFDGATRPLYRGEADAFSVEPALADVVIGSLPVRRLDLDAFEAAIPAALAAPAVNLRQGAFVKKRRWQVDWGLVRRLALIGLAILVVTLLTQLAAILRYSNAAAAAEEEARTLAGQAAPGAASATDPGARLTQRLIELRAPGMDYGVLAATLFGAISATPNAELGELTYERDGSLRATIEADGPATLTAVQDRVVASGFTAELGAPRSEGGRQTAELRVRAQ